MSTLLRRGLRQFALPLAVSAVLAACGGGSGDDNTPAQPPSEPLRVLVPAYFYPLPGSGWDQLALSAQATPAVALTAIVNPSNGAGSKADPKFADALAAFTQAGGKAIGYVPTGYGRTSQATVRAHIDRYLAFYGRAQISGFFLDEMSATPANAGYYRDLQAYIKGLDAGLLVVGNPGTPPSADYAAAADVLVTFEGQAQAYAGFDPQTQAPWVYQYSNAKQAMLVHDAASCSAMQTALRAAAGARNHTAWVYVTDRHYNPASGSGNPWATLPSYWDKLLASATALNQATALPGC